MCLFSFFLFLGLASISVLCLCAFLNFSMFFFFQGLALRRCWRTGRLAMLPACLLSMTLTFQINMMVLSLLVLKRFPVSLPAPLFKVATYNQFHVFFSSGFVAAGKRVARRRLFAVLTQFYNTEQPKRRRYKRERERERERECVCVHVLPYVDIDIHDICMA